MIERADRLHIRGNAVDYTVESDLEMLRGKLNEVIDELNKCEHTPLDYSVKVLPFKPSAP